MSDIQAFATRLGLDAAVLENQKFGQDPLRIDASDHRLIDGQVECLRVMPYGRFGNTLYSILNALLVGRALGVTSVVLPPIDELSGALPRVIGDMTFIAHHQTASPAATLIGNFFVPLGLESVTGSYGDGEAVALIVTYLTELYAGLLEQVGSLGSRVAAMHFRAGDIFLPGGGNIGYVQPPTSYYLKGFDHLAEEFGVTRAHLVYEDRSNPTIELVAEGLAQRGIAVTLQSASLQQDLVTLLSAQHIIAPYGTFCEASALLAPRLRTYTAFRRIATQANIPYWMQSRLGGILRAREVRTIVVDDPDFSYIAPESWARSDEQLELLRSYPAAKLRLMEKFSHADPASQSHRIS